MDPLTSAIAIVTLSAQSCKQTFNLISGLTNAPQSITHTRQLLMQTDECLIALEQLLVNNKKSSVLYSALRESSLDKALKSTRDICSDFGAAVTDVTKHSTDTRFSTRDRVLVHTKEAKIDRFNRQLGDCRTTLITVISAINMALANRACVGVEHLNDSAKAQETALAKVDTYLRNPSSNQSAQNKQTETGSNLIRNPSSNQSAQNRQTETGSNLIPSRILQETCKETLGATKAKRRVHRFVDMMVDDSSIAMQGIVGDPKEEVEQVFGKMTVTKQSRAFQGQMSEEAFATMFGADSWNPVK